MSNDTILCKFAMGSLDDFKNSPTAIETIPHIIVRERKNSLSNIVDSSVWVPELYRIILRRYKNWEIAFTNVSDFIDALWERSEIHFPNYYYRKSVYEKLLSLDDDDLLNSGVSTQKTNGTVTNTDTLLDNKIEHNNDVVSDPLNTVLLNVSSQNASKDDSRNVSDITQTFSNFADKSERIRAQIYNASMTILEDFLRKFKSLFILVTTRSNYYG